MNSRIALAPKGTLQCRDTAMRETTTKVFHGLYCMPKMGAVKSTKADSLEGHNHQTGAMDVWPQRTLFRKRLKEYLDAHGWTQDRAAAALGVELIHLRNCLYRKEKRLGIEPLQRAAALFGCSITEFIDDPAATVEGIPKEGLTRLSEAKRAVMFMMFQNLQHEDVSDEQALQYLKIIEAAVAAGKIRKPRWE